MMNKEELITVVAANAGQTKKLTKEVVDALFSSLMRAVADGEKVAVVGFGSFESASRPERASVNPQTGEPITVPAKTVPKFSAGKTFKEMVQHSTFSNLS